MSAAFAAFVEPFLEREPALRLAAQFARNDASRRRFLALSVLLRELSAAAILASDRRVAEAKLGWWLEEAQRLADAAATHPLAEALEAGDGESLAPLAAGFLQWIDMPRAADSAELAAQIARLALPCARLYRTVPGTATPLLHACLLRHSVAARGELADAWSMDLLARHRLSRAALAQAASDQRQALLRDSARHLLVLSQPSGPVADPALAASLTLERRWLEKLAHGRVLEGITLGPRDILASWWSARRAGG